MKCKNIQNNLRSFIDNEINFWEKIKIKNHLKRCTECSKKFTYIKSIEEMYRNVEGIETSPELDYSIDQKLKSLIDEDLVEYERNISKEKEKKLTLTRRFKLKLGLAFVFSIVMILFIIHFTENENKIKSEKQVLLHIEDYIKTYPSEQDNLYVSLMSVVPDDKNLKK